MSGSVISYWVWKRKPAPSAEKQNRLLISMSDVNTQPSRIAVLVRNAATRLSCRARIVLKLGNALSNVIGLNLLTNNMKQLAATCGSVARGTRRSSSRSTGDGVNVAVKMSLGFSPSITSTVTENRTGRTTVASRRICSTPRSSRRAFVIHGSNYFASTATAPANTTMASVRTNSNEREAA